MTYQTSLKKTVLALTALLALGCTQEREYKAQLKDEINNRSLIDTEAEYIYVPTVGASARTASASRPYWMGDAKRVKFAWTKDAIKVMAVELDKRFADNPVNNKPVMTIPVQYHDYKCQEDAFGECQNVEIENNEITWEHKDYFRADFAGASIEEVNFLPITLNNLGKKCHNEIGAKTVSYDIQPEMISFEVERTFRTNYECDRYQPLENHTFSVRHIYSFMRAKDITRPNYQAVQYPEGSDEGVFGFFTTQREELDVDNNSIVGGKKQFMNRWAPGQTVVYHLSEAFNNPGNGSVKKATYQAFDIVNQGLKEAGANLQLELREPDPSRTPNDLRNNMILLVEDPQASGVIGYGPSVADPLTGEILNARTVMYLGTIKRILKYTYDDLIDQNLNKIQESDAQSPTSEKESKASIEALAMNLPTDSHYKETNHSHAAQTSAAPTHRQPWLKDISEEQVMKLVADSRPTSELTTDPLHEIEVLARHNAYPAAMFNFHGAAKQALDEVLQGVELKPWTELSRKEKQIVMDALLPYVYLPTLVHELGHNLGLRHNFSGSEDKDNFYTPEELAEHGLSSEVKYSTVMDYPYSETNVLRVLGKYDIAALRFGYARKVELEDGSLVPVKNTLAEMQDVSLKSYRYCTDEHVAPNPNCNRFDEGTTLTEIAAHMIKSYHESYERFNFRRKRSNFSLLQDTGHIIRLHHRFKTLRGMYERFETIKNDFNLPANHEIWESNEFLKEVKASALMAGRFFLDVISTPDIQCVVAPAANPGQGAQMVPLAVLSKRAISCFDTENVALNDQYVMMGQAGRSFQSKKDPHSTNPYADQIDVRGIWMDKLVATRFLFARQLHNRLNDKYTENFLSMPELREEITKKVKDLLLDQHQGRLKISTAFGGEIEVNASYPLGLQKIREPMTSFPKAYFGLPQGETFLQKEVIDHIFAQMQSPLHAQDALLTELQVFTQLPQDGRPLSSYDYADVGGVRYLARAENKVAKALIANLKTVQVLSQFSAEKLSEVIAERKAKNENVDLAKEGEGVSKTSSEISGSEEDQVLYDMPLSQLEKFASGQLKDEFYYTRILEALAGE